MLTFTLELCASCLGGRSAETEIVPAAASSEPEGREASPVSRIARRPEASASLPTTAVETLRTTSQLPSLPAIKRGGGSEPLSFPLSA